MRKRLVKKAEENLSEQAYKSLSGSCPKRALPKIKYRKCPKPAKLGAYLTDIDKTLSMLRRPCR